jgi:hypothetical protein
MTKKESRVMRSFQTRVITQLGQGTFESVDLKNAVFSRWLVGYMASNKIPFQVVHLGENVTRIIKSGTICEHCNGKGFIQADTTPIEGLKIPEEDMETKSSHCCCGESCNCKNGCKDGGVCCNQRSKAA